MVGSLIRNRKTGPLPSVKLPLNLFALPSHVGSMLQRHETWTTFTGRFYPNLLVYAIIDAETR